MISLSEWFKRLFGKEQKRVIPLHRFDDLTDEEVDVLESAVYLSLRNQMDYAANVATDFSSHVLTERWQLTALLYEEINAVRADRNKYKFRGL